MSLFSLETDFFNHVLILLALMVGFTLFKIANCKPFKPDGEEFSWKELLLGTVRNLLVIIGSVAVYVISSYCGAELFLIKVGETEVTLQAAIDLVTLTILATYGVKYVKNLAEFAGVGDKAKDIEPITPLGNDHPTDDKG